MYDHKTVKLKNSKICFQQSLVENFLTIENTC